MTDYYDILGIGKAANASEIKIAYKRMAMQYHPDRNPGNSEAEETFKIINEAYHILSDPLKKSRYDNASLNNANTLESDTENYWREAQQRKRYQHWRYQYKPSDNYKFDRQYFTIQGLALIVFIVISGFCFGVVRLSYYFMAKQQAEVWSENSQLLRQVNTLFNSGNFEQAFLMVDTLRKNDPTEYRFYYTRDSLVTELKKLANSEFVANDFLSAAKHYNILKGYDGENQLEILNKIASCEYFLGHYEKSLLALKHIHNQQPRNIGLIYEIGLINYEKLDNKEEALQYFTLGKKQFKENLTEIYGKAFEIVMNPGDAPDIYYQIFEARARVNIDLKNYKDAITDCNWGVFLRPTRGESYYLRALAKSKHKDYWYICDDIKKAKQLGFQYPFPIELKYCK